MAQRREPQGMRRRTAEPISGLDLEAAIDLLLALNIAKSLGDLSRSRASGCTSSKVTAMVSGP